MGVGAKGPNIDVIKGVLQAFFSFGKKETKVFISEEKFIEAVSDMDDLILSEHTIISKPHSYEYIVDFIGPDKKPVIIIKVLEEWNVI